MRFLTLVTVFYPSLEVFTSCHTSIVSIFYPSLGLFLIGPEYGVHEQLCLLEIFKLAEWFLIDVFDLGEQLCSRPMGRRSDARNVASTGYGSKLLIG